MLYMCIKIFLARIVDVSLGTIRTVLVVKGRRITPAIVAFFEVLIWFVVAKESLNTKETSILIPIFYAGGYACGTYIGGFISNNFVAGIIEVSITTKSKTSKKLIDEIRNNGFGVSVINLEYSNDLEDKKMLIVQLNKKKLKDLTTIIKKNDKSAFVAISETKYVQNGMIHK